jgi:extradiol dioxygenase
MIVSQVAYVGIGVSNMSGWRSFAADVLGLQIVEGGDDNTMYLRMDEYHHRIALHPTGEDDVLYIGLQAPTPAAYEEGKAALRAAPVPVTQGTPAEIANRRVIDLVKFETGGLSFELSVGPTARWNLPFQPGRPMSGFKTGPLGFGHVVVRSDAPEDSVKLLTNSLGFRISDYINVMVFLHCNPRHHSIAFQPRGPNLPRSRDKKMWHFMLETNSLDDVGTALDLASKTGTPLASTLGRHSNDHMVSFYAVTPSGFEVEYGWGGRLIDDAVWQVQRHDRGSLWGHKPLPTPAVQSSAPARHSPPLATQDPIAAVPHL